MKKKSKGLLSLLFILVVLGIPACGGGGGGGNPPPTVTPPVTPGAIWDQTEWDNMNWQ